MAKWFNFLGRKKTGIGTTQFAERDTTSDWFMYFKQFGYELEGIEKFSQEDAYKLAGGLAEVFFPYRLYS